MLTSPSFCPILPTSGLAAVAMVVTALMLCGVVDYATGHDVSVLAFYAIPIILSMRSFGTWAGGVMAVLSAIVWLVADQQAGHHYSHPWFAYWNALHRLFFFSCAVVAFHHAQAAMKTNARLLKAFSGPLPVCTHCRRVGSGQGYWQKFESYLGEHGGAQPVSKVCPDCARESYAKAGMIDPAAQP